MSGMKSNLATCLLMMAGLAIHSGCGTANTTGQPASKPPNYPTGAIELKYYADGPWKTTTGVQCCDSSGNKFDLYYPTNLGANGFHHPILTWGNGTFGKPSNTEFFLNHMASWGFVVIATEDSETGLGQTILDGAKFLIKANSNSGSLFFNKLDKNQIGAFGHSQGAGGAIRAFLASAGTIKTVVPIELPAQVWCTYGPKCIDTKNLMSGSIFFIDGSKDIPISPPTQPAWYIGEQSIEAYYDATPASVEKVKGTIIGPGHNDIQGQPQCPTTRIVPGCNNGVYGYLGYPTAWFMDRLQGDAYAHGAFVNRTGEMFSETTNWELVASNIP
jgi:hypothetical protein